MSENIDLQPIKTKLSQPGKILVLFGQHATVDHVAGALSLYLTFKNQKKDVTIASPAEMRAEFSRLVGLDQIDNSISNRDLVIAFNNYNFSSIEKVSHNEGAQNKFELIIQPKTGQKAPDPKQVDFSFRGADAELIFVVGASKLEDLGALYSQETSLFTKATVVSFNRRQNPNFAAISIVDQEASSLSQMINEFLFKLGHTPKGDTATNLLAGIDFATNRFQNPMISADAFIAAGRLIQNGAKRQPPRLSPPTGGSSSNGGFMPFVPPSPLNRPPTPTNGSSSSSNQTTPNNNGVKKQSQAWTKPKIYKGGNTRI